MKLTYHSPFGPLILISDNGKLLYVNWDNSECLLKLNKFESEVSHTSCEQDTIVLNETVKQLDEYFSGRRIFFELPFEFKGTALREKVWSTLRDVKYGERITYKELANKCKIPKAVRAVANACGANPLAIIIPCHRVIGTGGKLGGYTGGIDKKIALLDFECTIYNK